MKANGKNIECKVCKKSFYISASRFSFKKYCSRECAKKDDFGFKPKIKACGWCGESFLIKNSLRTQDKYCSKECGRLAFGEKQKIRIKKMQDTPVQYKCTYCSISFTGNLFSKRKFCSLKCQSAEYSKMRLREKNPNYKTGVYTHENFQNRKSKKSYKHLNECRRYKKEFIAKHGYQFCEVCGVNQNATPKFEVHHIYFASKVPNHKNLHNNQNLIHLCLECHRKFHAGNTYLEKFKLLENERGLKDLFK